MTSPDPTPQPAPLAQTTPPVGENGLTEALRPWLRHDSTCMGGIPDTGCSCGLNAELHRLAAGPVGPLEGRNEAGEGVWRQFAEMDPLGCNCVEDSICVICGEETEGWDPVTDAKQQPHDAECLWIAARRHFGMPMRTDEGTWLVDHLPLPDPDEEA